MASAGDPPTGPRDAADQNFDYMFKLLLIGNSSVGKTSFLFRYADDSFTPAFVSTVGIDFKVKTVYRHDKRIKLQIWDTAGQERYRTITTAYYRGAMGFLLMYDVANQESFTAVQDWATQIKTYSWDNAQVILVGNKCDLEDERVVSTEDGRRLADDLESSVTDTSHLHTALGSQIGQKHGRTCILQTSHPCGKWRVYHITALNISPWGKPRSIKHSHTVEYYTAVKRDGHILYVLLWQGLWGIGLGGKSKLQRSGLVCFL
ncbi:ras-related protein Rab-3D isoform X2 [Zalophus californianus]|uniref:small monomeric GTPase n=1 Tax=Zalophus californianus TaxID=9704 RepID=A0A6J2CIJ8_ZALCA|nr:ras-related protein Rab-3D isoform X2 [Zalophus californianus]XP_027944556.1 ras-related protein Rab-3D isoform X3 [Eumetopias jubatus]